MKPIKARTAAGQHLADCAADNADRWRTAALVALVDAEDDIRRLHTMIDPDGSGLSMAEVGILLHECWRRIHDDSETLVLLEEIMVGAEGGGE